MSEWVKFDKDDNSTWPPENRKLMSTDADREERNAEFFIRIGNNIIFYYQNPCSEDPHVYQGHFRMTHWRKLPNPPEDL